MGSVHVFILDVKLSEEQKEYYSEVLQELGATVVPSTKNANVILTSLVSAARISKHLNMRQLNIPIVSERWIRECIKSSSLVPIDPYRLDMNTPISTLITITDDEPEPKFISSSSKRLRPQADTLPSKQLKSATTGSSSSERELSILDPHYNNTKYECCRPTLLDHYNEELVKLLEIIEKQRDIIGDKTSSLSYRKAISALKAYPRDLKSWKEAKAIIGIGDKIGNMIKGFLETGHISEADAIITDSHFKVLSTFYEVHGVGPTTAREWYNKGYHTIEDVLTSERDKLSQELRIGIECLEDFKHPIPREEVEEIAVMVKNEVDLIGKGFVIKTCGSYRRGKLFSGDVDIIISHPDEGKEGGLLDALLKTLQKKGLLLYILEKSLRSTPEKNSKSPPKNIDVLEKAFTVWKSPETQWRRRLDIIVTPWKYYWTAVLGWTGSKQFERSIRLWAKDQKGIKLSSNGLFTIATNKRIPVTSEREIFEVLGLEWREPEERNC